MPATTLNATPRPLAVCIDDLGLHAGVNQAAQELARAGRVSSWSCMVDGEAIADVATWLASNPHDNLELGLHLNLTEALPRAPWHRPLKTLILGCYLGAWRSAAARETLAGEIRRQLDAFEQRFGQAPDFIDGHQHVHQLPLLRDLLLAEIRRRWPAASGATRPWLRCCARPAPARVDEAAELPGPEWIKPRIIEMLGCHALGRAARQAGLRQNTRLLGVRRFESDPAGFLRLLDAWLARAGDQDVLMVHPAQALPGLADELILARAAECQVLQGPGFAALLARHGREVRAFKRQA
jgi:predicted glycoside hydrolase/deacetylase ChbG (UPF0249 family)